MIDRQPSDLAERRAALNPSGSFVVRAPAGSGKTELLTQRVLSLLAHCDKPEEILAITFTKKAASEMHERILNALHRAKNSVAPEEGYERFTWMLAQKALQRSDQQQWSILENPNRLHIQTIDSFCRYLSGKQPVSSQLGTLPDTLDDSTQSEQVLQHAFRETLDELKSNNEIASALTQLLLHFDNDVQQLEKLVISMLAKRDQWLEHLINLTDEDSIQESNRYLIEHLLQKPFEALKPWHQQIVTYFNHAFDNLANHEGNANFKPAEKLNKFPQPLIKHLDQWREIFTFLTTETGIRKPKGLNKTIGIPPESKLKKEIQDFFTELNELHGLEEILLFGKIVPNHPISSGQLFLVNNIRKVLLRTTTHLKLIFGQMRAADYTEIALAASQSLGDDEAPSDLSLKLDYRIKHILVDEFQDTSHLQLVLLKKLTAGWQPDDGHSLFIVGDAMQSCYLFRNADVRIFLDAIKYGIGNVHLTTLTLTENFRSEAGIVDWNNRIFSRAFPQNENINLSAVTYNPSIAFNLTQHPLAAQCYAISVHSELENEFKSEHIEAEKIVSIINSIRKNNPEDTIAILVRSRSHVQALLPALKTASIPWQATNMDQLGQRMAIIDLMSLTRALLYPADHLAWLSLLRSPIAGLFLQDLLILTEAKDEISEERLPLLIAIKQSQTLVKLSNEGQKIIQRISPIFQQALAQQQRKPLRQWIEGIWYTLGGPAGADRNQLLDCQHFFDLIEKFDHSGQIPDWPTFEKAIGKLYANDLCTEKNAVQIMTIHKSKGLEFNHVILPGLSKQTYDNDSEIFIWNEYFLDNNEQILVFGSPSEKGADENNRHYEFLKKITKNKNSYEAIRLLYVACTRAIKNLYLFGIVKTKKDGTETIPNKNSLLFPIWEDFRTQCKLIEYNSGENNGIRASTEKLEYIRRLPMDWQLPLLPRLNDLAIYRGLESGDEENIPELTSPHNFVARQIGTVIHRCLQKITEQGINEWSENYIQKQAWQIQLKHLGVPARLVGSAAEEIAKAIKIMLNSEQGRWILSNQHAESTCELEIFHKGKTAIIDRTFIDKGERWIIDYKTSVPDETQHVDEFLYQQSEIYKTQLQNYQFLMQKMKNLPTKTALYFPLLDKLVVVNHEPN